MEGCLTRLVPVDINRSGKAPGSVSVLLPRLLPSSCVSLGWRPWSSARNRAAERGLLLITKSHSPSHPVRSFGKSGNLDGEYQQGADGGGVWGSRTANVSCMWMGMWT